MGESVFDILDLFDINFDVQNQLDLDSILTILGWVLPTLIPLFLTQNELQYNL